MTRLLDGRTVIVTGAGGGVGRGIALSCAEHGANVVIAARRTLTGDEVANEIVGRGGHALSIRCDVTVRDDVYAAVDAAVSHFGGLDSMIHNALSFVGRPHETEEVPDETWHEMMSTAVRASFYSAQAAFPQLREQRGNADTHLLRGRRRRQPLHSCVRRREGRTAWFGEEPRP